MDTNMIDESNDREQVPFQGNYSDTTLPLDMEEIVPKKVFFQQYVYFHLSKNSFLLTFAKQNLMTTRPRSIYSVDFNNEGDMFITYNQNEQPIKYSVVLTRNLNIADVSWSSKYNCYFDYYKGTPFVVDADLVSLLYLASLEGDMAPEVIGEWMRSATKGRYTGFNPVHLIR